MTTLRVLVDAHMVGNRETGNETYVVGLISGLKQLPSLRVAALVDRHASLPDELTTGDVELIPLPTTSNWSRLLWGHDTVCRQWSADLLHVTYVAPWRCPCPFVVTLHDVSFRRFPEYFSPRDRLLFATLLPSSLRRAGAVVTDSEHAREEIARFFGSLATPVTSVPLAVSPSFRPKEPQRVDEVRRRYGTGDQYILAVGNLQPRKNLLRLVSAFARLGQDFPELHLVVVGQAQWKSSPLFSLVESLGISDRVTFPGYVDQGDLPALYQGARLFAYPSVYEGFGLPVLEAMACGTPVVAVATSSIPEVAGNAAALASSGEEDDLYRTMLTVLQDADLATMLAARGRDRVKKFSWMETAARTAAVYRSTVDRATSR